MARDAEKPTPERDQTDESLRLERQKTDRALAAKRAAVEEDADMVLERARGNADAVLAVARAKADAEIGHSPASTLTTLADERAIEDKTLRKERAVADANLEREREESVMALARLLPLERVKTDRFLLTERVQSDDAVANRDDFLGIVSHDLRNLLGGIVMSAGMASTHAPQTAEGQHILRSTDRIQRYAARMNRLIGDLLDVASIDAGKLAVAPLPGDAQALVCEAVELFQVEAQIQGIKLDTPPAGASLTGTFDHDRILQVLANLIANAIKFTARGGHIEVKTARADGALRFSVSDTGRGIHADNLEKVFDRFAQIGSDRRGVGLGLYISRSLVDAHGGRIWAESQVGDGSTFIFSLPDAGRP
ncbi:MAG: HAMP domain-containing histidine kinase [Acidobacteriota bacterium]|nr:HAMP domain-containing histidine kinase [Acidobacteriota bacterium]